MAIVYIYIYTRGHQLYVNFVGVYVYIATHAECIHLYIRYIYILYVYGIVILN